ncbi:AzlC family ABC transporter permease [Xaviernesmea oryzae]|uniref:Predicted branched-chain amino acid permease (Azaleucine resistance) n=1 Tax=Xaviernesmea oryzae TaxID=464029 RepID=A0A1X7GBH5_9HYPH|nr:AzlC family ABC transporter permease [Xaviernesmea oryzae]SMF67039.1 Predicted branched-chain amino acid permease (azaleucine resistance) [Xaviernesmea oryzae]
MSPDSDDRSALSWFFTGMRGLVSLPALILLTSIVGFSAFALESGLTRAEAVFMSLAIWALPAQVILIGSMASGANIAACFLAVTLSSIRMTPMVASIIPEMRTKRTPIWALLILSHFIAITSWVFAITTMRNVPRQHRAIYFAGFGVTLTLTGTLVVAVFYGIASSFPPVVAGVLFFLTPVYFIASIWASARQPVVKLAFVMGVALGPLLALVTPEFDVLYAGIGGGTIAYLIDRSRRRKKRMVKGAAR